MNRLTKIIRARGWTAKTLGEYWGLTPRQMTNITKKPNRRTICAIRGLPDKRKKNE